MLKFPLGSIVSLLTHPFTSDLQDITIAGNHIHTPPLMVVIEIIKSCDKQFKVSPCHKYKCLWFSSRRNNFEEFYFLETDLKMICCEEQTTTKELEPGQLVVLSTNALESNKRKSSITFDLNYIERKKDIQETAFLNFVSPVMSISCVKPFHSSRDTKASTDIKQQKIYPSTMVKCKWFDLNTDKFLELFIPRQALTEVPMPPYRALTEINIAIKHKFFLIFDGSLIKPICILNNSGIYSIKCFDFVLQQLQIMVIKELVEIKTLSTIYLESAPRFIKDVNCRTLQLNFNVEMLFKKYEILSKQPYVSLRYRDRYGIMTERTISNYEIIIIFDQETQSKSVKYIHAYCHSRNAYRNFRLENILEANILQI